MRVSYSSLIDWLCVRVCVLSMGTQDYGSGDEADGPPGTRSRRHSSPGESRSGSATELHVQEYADSVGSPRLAYPTPPPRCVCLQCFVSLLNVPFLYCCSVYIMFRATFCGKKQATNCGKWLQLTFATVYLIILRYSCASLLRYMYRVCYKYCSFVTCMNSPVWHGLLCLNERLFYNRIWRKKNKSTTRVCGLRAWQTGSQLLETTITVFKHTYCTTAQQYIIK